MKGNINKKSVDLAKYLEPHLEEKIIALPLEFEYLPVEIVSKQFTKLNSPHPYRIHYLGPRFTNTQILHKKYSGSSPVNQNSKDSHLFQDLFRYTKYQVNMRKMVQSNFLNEKLQDNHYYKSAIFYRAFEGMNPTLNREEEFLFNSCFESGNLDCVIKIQPFEFDLFLRIDSNTRGHTQWFYFSVQNGKKLGNVTFNICNLSKPRTLYEQGMKPYIFSKKQNERNDKKWHQDGSNVELIEKKFNYSLIEEMMEPPCVFKLSFDYLFQEQDDEVFFAYSIPYTYSQMLKDISDLPKSAVKKSVLGRSLTGVEIPILHITNHDHQEQINAQQAEIHKKPRMTKKNVLITGRIHPGESNGSHVLKGFIQFLCGNSPHAHELRNRMNFFIVPMLNPDGVIMGNSRSCAAGKDLNREYLSNKKQLYPEVHLIKNLAFRLQKNEGLMMFFDFHGHSRKKNTFFYGPGYSLSEPQYYKSRALAKIIEKINPSFRYYSCSFMISEQKKKTGRAVLFDQIKIPYVFTVQSSIGLFYDCVKLKTIEFTAIEWENMGQSIAQGLSQFIVAFEEYEEMIRQRRLQRKRRKQKMLQNHKKIGGKKFIEEDTQIQETGSFYPEKKSPSSMLMFELLEEIKAQPTSKIQQNLDPEASSDDHDDAENLQSSKLAEFNNLVIYSKQKDQMSNPNRMAKVHEDLDESIMKPKRVETQMDQMQLIKQVIEEGKKNAIKTQNKISQVSAHCNINSNSFMNKMVPSDHHAQKKSPSFGTTSMKLSEQQKNRGNAKAVRDQSRLRKSINFQTHRHVVSKQFFPMEKCEIVDLPKSSAGNRKDIKKGRVMIEEYLSDKIKEKQQRQERLVKERNKSNIPYNNYNQNTQFQARRKPKYSWVEDRNASQSVGKMNRFKIEDMQSNKITKTGSLHRNTRFMDKKIFSLSSTAHIGQFSSTPNTNSNKQQNMRIFDTVMFSGFQGMQVDNMAMMIKTFNK